MSASTRTQRYVGLTNFSSSVFTFSGTYNSSLFNLKEVWAFYFKKLSKFILHQRSVEHSNDRKRQIYESGHDFVSYNSIGIIKCCF